VTDQKNKLILDEQTFEKLLAAAYVIQEHNREMREMEASVELSKAQLRQPEKKVQPVQQPSAPSAESSSPKTDYVLPLAEIVETQREIQKGHLESDDAMAMIAERATRITKASGAAVGILNDEMIFYRAGVGSSALPFGSRVPMDEAICAFTLRTGQALCIKDVKAESGIDKDLFLQRGIQSLVAGPIYRDGNIVGALELYFDKVHGFAEQDIHTCQLMAGLVTEAMGRDAESALKKTVAAERTAMLAALEQLKPNLTALAEDHSSGATRKPADETASAAKTLEGVGCWKCGHTLIGEDQFCGNCGAPRSGDIDSSRLQSKVASLWLKQKGSHPASSPANHDEASPLPDLMPSLAATEPEQQQDIPQPLPTSQLHEEEHDLPEPFAALTSGEEHPVSIQATSTEVHEPGVPDLQSRATALVKILDEDVTWTSATKARSFLEELTKKRPPNALLQIWRARRGDFYLAVAIILVGVVILWAILSNPSVSATGRGAANSAVAARRKAVPELSTFDKLLVSLGLAEAPEPPPYKGNPATQVWVDSHTALYYCPGADLYGKTPNGKFATQRDAQLDQFEPADRKACD
jgi:GAF domain-containing protein